MTELTIDDQSAGARIDVHLSSRFPEISRASWQRRIATGAVLHNHQPTKPKQLLRSGDIITLDDEPVEDFAGVALPIIYENDDFLVINKPPGLLTHPIRTQPEEQSVVGLLRGKLPSTSDDDTRRPGVVHRLDRDTSGVLLLAKTTGVQQELSELFAKREVHKTYRAVLQGKLEDEQATIKLPLGRNMSAPATFKVDPNGKSAETIIERLDVADGCSYVRLTPLTGRTHQLRVHCAHIGHPIVGDALYGRPAGRLMLHAHRLEFTYREQPREFEATLPSGFER